LIAALKNKRRALGAEKEPKYLEIAKDRIARLRAGTLSIRKIGTPIFQPTGREKVSQIPVEWTRQE
jgi:DNA modification methylase